MRPISSDKWKEIEALLDQALDLPVSERTVFLEDAAKDDKALKTLLMEFWQAGHEAKTFLEEEIPADVVQVIQQLSLDDTYGPAPVPGMLLGKYKVGDEIGRGGMSVVYKAHRVDGQFDHTVAIKLLKRGMDTDQLVLRFKTERQILAGLQHANIANLLDGGATPDGRPYLVMEYVEGMRITDYCDHHKLDISRRLALFKKVGEAVGFAHRNLIVHRDLKPSNILVTSSGEVKLLDFGIAKVLTEDVDETVLALTMMGSRVMTPDYAAPEQIYGEPITTATDVYAMGVLLYELLCGELPIRYEVRKFPAIERTMRSQKVTLPSVSLKQKQKAADETISAIASARGTTSLSLAQRMEGDLDMIVNKALHKEPERRYRSIPELLNEIERYQKGLPIDARPDTLGYRAKKFYGRYKTGVILSFVVLLSLVAGLVGTLWQAREARIQSDNAAEERDLARMEANKSARVTEFLVDVFEATDPDNTGGDTLNAYDILQRGAMRIENDLNQEPEIRAEMMTVIGRMYQRMAAYEDAEIWLQRALDERNDIYEPDNVNVLDSYYNLASLMQDQGRYQAAESLLTIEISKPFDATDKEGLLRVALAKDLLGTLKVDNGKYDEAQQLYEEALATCIEIHGEDHPHVAEVSVHLGELMGLLSNYDEAKTYFERAIDIFRTHPDGNTDNLAEVLYELSDVLRTRGEFDEAKQFSEESLSLRRQLFGDAHPLVVKGMNLHGNIHSEMGDNDEAGQIYQAALEIQRNSLGEKHPDTIELLGNLGGNLIRKGDLKQAVVYLREALALREEVLGADHPTVAIALANLGVAIGSLGNYEEEEQMHRRCLEIIQKHFDDRHPGVASCAGNLANVLRKLGRYEEALEHASLALEIDKETLDPNHRFLAISTSVKGQILFDLGRFDEAQALLEESIAIFDRSSLPDDHQMPIRPKIALGKLHLSQNRLDQAQPLLEESLRVREKVLEPDDWRLGEAEAALGLYHLKRGAEEEAKVLLEAGYERLLAGLGARHRLTIEARDAIAAVTHISIAR